MNRYIVQVSLVVLVLFAPDASAQEWARKMFPHDRHNFGTVARGAKSEYSFELTNIYQEDIHIASVRASCGCVTPTVTKDHLKTWEKGGIHARFNTESFLGQRSATITVTIDRPFFAEVQLNIEGVIRGDVVVQPGAVLFGTVDQGGTAQQQIKVSRNGHRNWEIADVRSAHPDLQVEIVDSQRHADQTEYTLLAKLVAPKKTGFFRDQMVLVTNDPAASQLTVTIEGNVKPALTVSPASLSLGTVNPGDTVNKQLVVRSKEPFRITKVHCNQAGFEFHPPQDAKELHLIPIQFTADAKTGELACQIEIETDRGPAVVGTCIATAHIVPAPEKEDSGLEAGDISTKPAAIRPTNR